MRRSPQPAARSPRHAIALAVLLLLVAFAGFGQDHGTATPADQGTTTAATTSTASDHATTARGDHGSSTAADHGAAGGGDHGPAAGEHGAAGEHHEEKFLGLPAWIFKLINMILFFGIIAYFAGGPIKRALESRRAGIQREAEEARERRAKADQMAADIQTRLGQLAQEIQTIQDKAVQEGERQKRELLAAAEAEAAKILASARAEVDARIKTARRELTELAGELASDRAEQILRERINDADRQKIFRDSLKEVEEVRS